MALARVARDAIAARRLPFRPALVDALALVFAAFVLLYAVLPQSALGGEADATTILYALRHDLACVAAYFLGRSIELPPLRRLVLVTAAGRRRARDRGDVHGADRALGRRERSRLLPRAARLRPPRPAGPAGELRLQHRRRERPAAPRGVDVSHPARDRVPARRRALLLGGAAARRLAARGDRGGRAALHVHARRAARARGRVARDRVRAAKVVAGRCSLPLARGRGRVDAGLSVDRARDHVVAGRPAVPARAGEEAGCHARRDGRARRAVDSQPSAGAAGRRRDGGRASAGLSASATRARRRFAGMFR